MLSVGYSSATLCTPSPRLRHAAAMRRTLTLATAAGLLVLGLAACNPTVTATGSSNDGANPTSGPSTHSVVGSNAGASGSSSAPTKAAAPAGPLLKTSGSGIKNTAQFTTGDSWTLHYSYDCSNFGQAGNFAVIDETGMPLVNEIKLKGSGSTPQYNGGTHHLQINSECDWTVTVTNG